MFAGGTGSDHIKRNLEIFKFLGIESQWYGYNPFKILFKKADYLYLNWYEVIYNGNFITSTIFYLGHELRLLLARLLGLKIITSFHNKEPHSKHFYCYRKRLLNASIRHADAIVVFNQHGKEDLLKFLTKTEIEKRAYYIPAINYIGVYPLIEHSWITQIEERKTVKFLFFGSLHPKYKNFEMAVDVAKQYKNDSDVDFIFAGKLGWDADRKNQLKKDLLDYSNIFLHDQFIDNNEMAHLLRMSDVIIIPYDVDSINNSGTTRLAFSYARTVLCPYIPSLDYIPSDLVYTYSYQNREQHRLIFKQQIDKVLSDYRKDPSSITVKGQELKHIMETNNSFDALREKYKKLFEDLDKL